MNNFNFVGMAFSTGKESTEGGSIKRYIGVAPIKVLAVNPNKTELEKLYNTTLENEIEYISEKDGVKSVRIDFIVQTDAEKSNGIDLITKASFYLKKEYRFNKDQSKVQVIDKYGRTAWVTKVEMQNHAIPQYINGPANLDSDYRPVINGEEYLTDFIKNYLNIPNVMRYIDKKWVMVDNPADCEARLSNVDALFEGNFKEVKDIATYQPNNKVKVMFGVKTTDDGKQYQTVYTQMTLKNSVSDYSKLDADLKDRKNNGAYPTTEFEAVPLKEYVVEATNFEEVTPVSTDSWFK